MKRTAMACSVASALAMLAAAPQAGAAGFALYEQGVSGMGNAYAGQAAATEDATTVWWNPAGMSRLPSGKHFAVAGAYVVPSWKFHDNGSQTAAAQTSLGGTGGDAGSGAFVPSMFYVMDINPALNFGLGISVPFGLKTEYDSTWLGRFQGVKSEVKTLNINPAVSYKLSDAASLGFGVNYQRGEVDLITAVNYSAAAAQAGNIALAGGPGVEGQNHTKVDGDAWGFNIGGLFQVAPASVDL